MAPEAIAQAPQTVLPPDTSPGAPAGALPNTPPSSATAHGESTAFGVAPAGFKDNVDPRVTALAQEMGWPITDQGIYNLIALMRVSGGSDGYFDTGDIVSGALAMGYEIDGPEALNALADFRTIFANGTTGNEASMKAAHAENTDLLNELAGGQPLNEMFAKTDSKEATDLFHATVRSLATAISTGDTAAWEEAYPWLQKFDLQYLNFDWDHLGLKDPTPGRQPASGPQDTEAKPMASAQGLSGTAL